MQRSVGLIAVGVDIGGTQTRVGAVDRTGRVLAGRRWRTGETCASERLACRIVEELAAVRLEVGIDQDADVPWGVAIPGTFDGDRKRIVRSIRLPFIEGTSFIGKLADRGVPIPHLLTDAEASTWGEYSLRAPRPRRFAHIRLGTGVACGIVTDGMLQRLDADRTTHLDFLVGDDSPEAPVCQCGRRGCLEAVASGVALERQAYRLGHADGLAGLHQAWLRSDESALRIVREAAEALSVVTANVNCRFGVKVICVGGGVTEALPCLLEQAIARMHSAGHGSGETIVSLVRSRSGDDAGMIGAALLAIEEG